MSSDGSDNDALEDNNVEGYRPTITPRQLKAAVLLRPAAVRTIRASRRIIRNIITGKDRRFLVAVGPCSINSIGSAMEYGTRLKNLIAELPNLLVVMRTYFEKPRTTTGWTGLLCDPHLDGSNDGDTGLRLGRELLINLAEIGLPTITEILGPDTPQYIGDVISCATIGARTTESQTHREMASGISAPVGFKNSTAGSKAIAKNAMLSACSPHTFRGIDLDGRTVYVDTKGKRDCFAILRGGDNGTNYDRDSVNEMNAALAKAGLYTATMVDCSHKNSGQEHEKQVEVLEQVVADRAQRRTTTIGAMVESNLLEGKQSFPSQNGKLIYGLSITDACVGWETTARMLRHANEQLR